MKIKYLGHSSFFLRFKKARLVIDPFDSKMVGLPFPRQEADIVLITHHHKDHDQAQLVKGNPVVIDLPGEYEIKQVKIRGFLTYHDDKKGALRGENTIYKIESEGISFLHLGDLGHLLSEEMIEKIGEIDVIFIPVGGIYTIGPEQALKLINEIEPKIIIPMHYNHEKLNQEIFGKLASVDEFVKNFPSEKVKKVDILSLSDSEVKEKESEVIVFEI